MDFYEPSTDVYNLLQEVATACGATVDMGEPETVTAMPAFTYFVPSNEPTYTHDVAIGKQVIEIVIDIWAEDMQTANTMLSTLVATFNTARYMLTLANDVPDPSTNRVAHKHTTFKLIK